MSNVVLVDYDKTFFELSKDWISDPEINTLIAAGPLPLEEKRLEWYNSLSSRKDYKIKGVLYEGQPIGVCGLKNITDTDAEYWGYIGVKSFWGKGLGGVSFCYAGSRKRAES